MDKCNIGLLADGDAKDREAKSSLPPEGRNGFIRSSCTNCTASPYARSRSPDYTAHKAAELIKQKEQSSSNNSSRASQTTAAELFKQQQQSSSSNNSSRAPQTTTAAVVAQQQSRSRRPNNLPNQRCFSITSWLLHSLKSAEIVCAHH